VPAGCWRYMTGCRMDCGQRRNSSCLSSWGLLENRDDDPTACGVGAPRGLGSGCGAAGHDRHDHRQGAGARHGAPRHQPRRRRLLLGRRAGEEAGRGQLRGHELPPVPLRAGAGRAGGDDLVLGPLGLVGRDPQGRPLHHPLRPRQGNDGHHRRHRDTQGDAPAAEQGFPLLRLRQGRARRAAEHRAAGRDLPPARRPVQAARRLLDLEVEPHRGWRRAARVLRLRRRLPRPR